MRIDWISVTPFCFEPNEGAAALVLLSWYPGVLSCCPFTGSRPKNGPCWFSIAPFGRSPQLDAVVSFNGHRQKVFNLMLATWAGNLSYEHTLHSQKIRFTSASQRKKRENPLRNAAHNATNQQKPRLRSWRKSKNHATNMCIDVCMCMCVCVSSQHSAFSYYFWHTFNSLAVLRVTKNILIYLWLKIVFVT